MRNEELSRLRAKALASSAWPLNAPPPPPQPFDLRPDDMVLDDGALCVRSDYVRREWEEWDAQCEKIRLRARKLENAG